MADNKLIGLYGGAFDPIHKAHISIAQNCIETIGLNKVIFIPTGNSPTSKILSGHHHRLEMLNIVCKERCFEFSDFEINEYFDQKKISYTINTLKHFKKKTSSTLLFILGTDAFSTINFWYKWNEILSYCHLVLIERGSEKSDIGKMSVEVQEFFKDNVANDINELKKIGHGKIYPLPMSVFRESSSEIRDRSMKNLNIKKFLPKTIQDYIDHNKLYRLPGHNK
jgi:nicotinate-nucleotide adenylyltransferase